MEIIMNKKILLILSLLSPGALLCMEESEKSSEKID
ncbi:MAG: hypothetical protein US13_C0014G0019 [candidate division TM6 bacterium GW2011_GWE2_36_25]|nr:MAG: hypothetical protein US03_C0013G0019 [candidate division TM6 bacterium GW2011_GWF2_36_131]KKQ02562.1 MAG: hypothetical protein US13_C0014G0019 [candidate division TM6 bacterium GW2011_GWE2_36_25]KKQ19317.1 MAG: hypothetical protein US32_C0011G0019 [candidate division TM6 bacterium GW2011_GWA2_36_9]